MTCSHCAKQMFKEYVYPITGQTLWKCKTCGRTELVEDLGKPAFYNSLEEYESV